MSRLTPNGRRKRYALMVATVLLGSALSVGATGCGGGKEPGAPMTGPGEAKQVDFAQLKLPPMVSQPAGEFNGQKAESYSAVVENEFRSPLVEPRSTFSSDVNTASYANVRRFITQQNQLPPRDAVLLAELINYFPYTYPEPTGTNPVSLTLDISPCPWKPEHRLARIGVKAKDIAAADMPARNLVFLIDTSGSMHEANRLPLVKKALHLLIDTLTAKDRVTIVTYAGEAGLKLPTTAGDRSRAIRDVVDSLHANGSTNGGGGIQLAYEKARQNFIEGGSNRVILCTDGDFNVGVSSPSDLRQLIEKERASRVYLSCLGFGMGNYKDDRLKDLANHGNGQHAYIDSLDEARKVFVEQGASLVCVAKDVKFQVDFNPARVNAYRLIGYENRIMKQEDFKNDAKDAGDMGGGHTVTALYEIVPAGVKIDLPSVDPLKYQKAIETKGNAEEWLTVKMRYKQPDGEASKEQAAVLKGAGTEAMGEDFRFASAVAEFGLVLRESPHRGHASLDAVIERASAALGDDPNGHRREFVEIARRAKGLTTRARE